MKTHKNIILCIIVEILFIIEEYCACPTECICKWKGGKQSVNCSNKDLLSIPYGMDPGTQVLDFSGNNLRVVQSKRFFKLELVNIQRLYLSRCHIVSIDDRAFVGLTNLVELDLSQNMISAIPLVTFVDYPQLMRLILNENPIKHIPSFAFHDLSFLMALELSNCEIDRVDEDAFSGLNNLEWLKLDGNRLEYIKGTDLLPSSLHGIDLHRNRWNCDCRLLDLHTWLHNFKVPITIEPTCSKPSRLQKRAIKSVNVSDLACLPDISPTTLYLEISEGKNISLLCRVQAIPEAHVSWWFQGQLLQNDTTVAPGYHLLYYIEEGAVEKKSELFIYNTNTEDNGTFICAAENPAGKSLSNYTIRVIVKEEPIIVVVPFPLEYFIAIITAVTLLVIFIVICLVIIALRCRNASRVRKKKNNGKDAILNQRDEGRTKTPSGLSEASLLDGFKSNGGVLYCDTQSVNPLIYPNSSASITIDSLSSSCVTKFCSPSSNKSYQNDQNPDLINDAEIVGKNLRQQVSNAETNSESNYPNPYKQAMSNVIQELDSRANFRRPQWSDNHILVSCKPVRCEDFYQHAADIHLSPGCFVADTERCTVSFSQPKPLGAPHTANVYRTLPHRPKLSVSASSRFSRDAEFLSCSSSQPASYEHFSADVRYTAEGYPCPIRTPPVIPVESSCLLESCNFSINMNELPKTCSTDEAKSAINWPSCMPASVIDPSTTNTLRPVPAKRKCVGAQTEVVSSSNIVDNSQGECSSDANKVSKLSKTTNDLLSQHVQEILTESPDEGYEGDGNDNVEM